MLFTSSISTLDNWASKYPRDKFSESTFYDSSVAAALRHGASQYVSEQLLDKAGKISSTSAAICRVSDTLQDPAIVNMLFGTRRNSCLAQALILYYVHIY